MNLLETLVIGGACVVAVLIGYIVAVIAERWR